MNKTTRTAAVPSTVYCYDRFAGLKRAAALLGISTGIAAGLLLGLPARAAQPSQAQTVQQLPTVVITGKAVRSAKPEVQRLPTVVITARRTLDGQQIAQR